MNFDYGFSLVERHERFRGVCCLHLQGSSPYCLPTHLQEIEFQNTAVLITVLLSQIPLWRNLASWRMWLVIKTELEKESTLKLYFIDTVLCIFTILIWKYLQGNIISIRSFCVIWCSEQNSSNKCPETRVNRTENWCVFTQGIVREGRRIPVPRFAYQMLKNRDKFFLHW